MNKFKYLTLILGLFVHAAVLASTSTHLNKTPKDQNFPVLPVLQSGQKTAIFAGGCFWCMEEPFEQVDGVLQVISGFSGGSTKNPSYSVVTEGKTGHRESVWVVYDSKKVSFEKLLNTFWQNINPCDEGGQFADRGFHYSTAIFYQNENEKKLAEQSKMDLTKSQALNCPVATAIVPYQNFYPAENDHQDYYRKQPSAYQRYKEGSGRAEFLRRQWPKKSK